MTLNGIIAPTKINTDVAAEPVLLSDAKTYLRISNTSEDTLITSLIKSARLMLEKYTGLFFKPVNVTVSFTNQMGGGSLPYPANGSVTYDSTLNADFTSLDTPYLSSYSNPTGVLKATYDTGFTALPEDLKTAILAQVSFMYFNRGDDNKAGKLSEAAIQLASNYRQAWI